MEENQDISKFLETNISTKNNHHSPMEYNLTSEFCTSENVNSCLIYLNQELTSHGMQPMFANQNDFCISSLVNSTFETLQKIRQLVATRDSLEEGKHKALCEVQQLEAEKKRLKASLSAVEKELASSKNRVDCLCRELLEKDIKIKNDKEEVRNLQAALRSKEMQHKNVMRREEREMNRLKDQLGSLLCGKRGHKLFDGSTKVEGNGNHYQKFSTNGNQFDFPGVEFKILADLRRLNGKLCTINANLPNIGGMHDIQPEPNFINGFSEQGQLNDINELIKCMEGQISKIQKKFDGGCLAEKDWSRALKDKNNLRTQISVKTSSINKASGDSTWRPKSAIQHANKKRIEPKSLPHRSRSIMSANAKSCHRPPVLTSAANSRDASVVQHCRPTCSSQDDKNGERLGRLIRSESYTILKDNCAEDENVVNIDILSDIVSQDVSTSQCISLSTSSHGDDTNRTFLRGVTSRDSEDDFYI